MTTIVSRAEWGARRAKDVTPLPWNLVDAIAIHYSAAYSDEFPSYKQRVQGIQNYHMDTQGWSDIAYNFLVSRDGQIFTGRGWRVMSAATLGHNDHTVAFCFLGADKKGRDDITDKGRRAFSQLIFAAEKASGKTVNIVHAQHTSKGHFSVGGHRDFVNTDCPGDELYAFITMKGWQAYRAKPKVGYPKDFFKWAAWKLGEGAYAKYGPEQGPRPNVPYPITPAYWVALRRFLKARGQ